MRPRFSAYDTTWPPWLLLIYTLASHHLNRNMPVVSESDFGERLTLSMSKTIAGRRQSPRTKTLDSKPSIQKSFVSEAGLGRFLGVSQVLVVLNFPLCGYDWQDEDRDCEVDECGPWPGQDGLQSCRKVFVVGGRPVHGDRPDRRCEGHVDLDDELTNKCFGAWYEACGHVVGGCDDGFVLLSEIG
jgi:hypothetical protein